MWRYFHCHVTWMSFQVRIRHLWCVIWPQIKSWFELHRAFWPLTAAIHMYVRLAPVSRERKSMFSLFGKAPKRGKQNYLFLCITQRLSRRRPPSPAAGLRSRGDESDQSDQSTEITVIPEVRRRAEGHSEFTHPTQARDKSVQEWQTCMSRVEKACAFKII